MRISVLQCAVVLAALAAGCGSAQPTTSTISGKIAQASFPLTIERITIVNDAGVITTAPVAADGSFKLIVTKGTAYRFSLAPDGKSTPIVVRSEGGRLETRLQVTGGGASVDIGSVRYWGGSTATAGSALATTGGNAAVGATSPLAGTPAAGACLNGLVSGTSQPCSTSLATAVCVDEDNDVDGKGHGEHGKEHGDKEHGDKDHDHHGDGDGAQANVSDPATDATAAESVGIPELSLPAGIGCGGCEGHHEGHH